jgi:nitrogen fixation NifU-like protein
LSPFDKDSLKDPETNFYYLAGGNTIENAWNILPDHVINFLQTLPEDHYHCAELSLGSFYLALSDYSEK